MNMIRKNSEQSIGTLWLLGPSERWRREREEGGAQSKRELFLFIRTMKPRGGYERRIFLKWQEVNV